MRVCYRGRIICVKYIHNKKLALDHAGVFLEFYVLAKINTLKTLRVGFSDISLGIKSSHGLHGIQNGDFSQLKGCLLTVGPVS